MSYLVYPPGTGGAGAPDTVQYLVLALDAGLSQERRLVLGEGLGINDGGANSDYSVSVASRVIDRSPTSVDVTVSTTVTIYLFTVPSNMLSTNKAINFQIMGDLLCSTAGSGSFSLFIAFGATTMYSGGGTITVGAARRPWFFDLYLCAENATNAQVLGGLMTIGTSGGATTGIGDINTDEIQAITPVIGTGAVDSTVSQTFMVAIKMSTAGASSSWKKRIAFSSLI